MDNLIAFMQSGAGRITRIALGIVLLAIGNMVQGVTGVVIGVIGVIPLVAGIVGVCLFAPLFGYTLHGNHRLH